MSIGPISVAESWTFNELVSAGWIQEDLDWEQASEATLQALVEDDAAGACEHASTAVQIARQRFDENDPRLATSLSNLAACRKRTDHPDQTDSLVLEARRIWAACDPWIEQMKAPRTARSSLFHMRMEQLHRDAYEQRWEQKWRELVAEARARLNGPTPADIPAMLERWRRERPAMLNDTRKLIAAVLLQIAV